MYIHILLFCTITETVTGGIARTRKKIERVITVPNAKRRDWKRSKLSQFSLASVQFLWVLLNLDKSCTSVGLELTGTLATVG